MKIFGDLAAALFPRPETNEPLHTFRWRQTVALAIIVLGGFQMLTTALSWGFIPAVFAGFVTVGQFAELKGPLTEIRVSQIERNIRDAREAQCYAQIEGNMAALQLATYNLEAAKSEYRAAAAREPYVPACNELIVSKK